MRSPGSLHGGPVRRGAERVLWSEAADGIPSPNVLTFVFGQLGVVAALVWYLWYQTAKEMPAARRDFLAALEAQRTDHTSRVAPFMDQLRELQEAMHALVMAQQDLTDAVREATEIRRTPRPTRGGVSSPGPPPAPGPHT